MSYQMFCAIMIIGGALIYGLLVRFCDEIGFMCKAPTQHVPATPVYSRQQVLALRKRERIIRLRSAPIATI